jgi:hypothetical protein
MSWDNNEAVDWEELNSIIAMMPKTETAADLRLWVYTGVQRIVADGAEVQNDEFSLSAYGYATKFQRYEDDRLIPAVLYVARYIDAATASLSSFLISSSAPRPSAKVILRSYKAGTNEDDMETPAAMEIILLGARPYLQAFVNASPTGMPAEILGFSYLKMTINTRSQLTTGQNAAVRSCEFSW